MAKQIKSPKRRSLNVVEPPPLGPLDKPPPPPPKVPLDGYRAPEDLWKHHGRRSGARSRSGLAGLRRLNKAGRGAGRVK